MQTHANEAMHDGMVEAGADHPGVPALLWLPVVQGLLPIRILLI